MSTVSGRILRKGTRDPVGWVQVLLLEAHRSTMSSEDGYFRLVEIPAGIYQLKTFRIGYKNYRGTISVHPPDSTFLILELEEAPLGSETIIVEGNRNWNTENVALDVSGTKLRQNLGNTVAETVSAEPGMDLRSMGPAPARPVLRGLSGDRLLVLEDGSRTGDLSATSTDHAVVIEPITAEKIEVIRGPAALLYGSNTIGGVINVQRDYVPTSLPEAKRGNLSLQGETVNRGYSGGFLIAGPVGSVAWRLDGSLRDAQDISTPVGRLKNTSIHTANTSAGISHVTNEGYIGTAGGYYESEYGVPGGFVGAHPKGVLIRLHREHFEVKADRHFDESNWSHVQLHYTFSNYFHREFESDGSVGTQFSVLSYHLNLKAHRVPKGPLGEGIVGIWGEFRDYAPGGFIFTPKTREMTAAAYWFQSLNTGPWNFQASARFDARSVQPSRTYVSPRIGQVRRRDFFLWAGSVRVVRSFDDRWKTGVNLTKSGRAPGIEELFSEGPHLASYSFEVGNPSMGTESGYSAELFTDFDEENIHAEASIFATYFDGYIYPRNSGAIHIATSLPVYQYASHKALLVGSEASVEYEMPWSLFLNGSASYVRGELLDSNRALPAIPPLSGKLELKRSFGSLTTSATVKVVADQTRVDRFEEPTNGYAVLDLDAQWFFKNERLLHTLVLSVDNVTDKTYRRHLSRVRSIMPEPRRNIRLLYKVFF